MSDDLQAIWLTFRLSLSVTVILLLLASPLAWWLARTRSFWKGPVSAIVALPLVLPPTVLGFYFLMAMGPDGPIGKITEALGIGLLPFTFWGLVVASCFYSLPFVVQPLQNAFEQMGSRPLEAAACMGATPWRCFARVVLPLTKPGYISAAVLGFAHTVGEFGVVLMIGGNIPGETKVLSVQIYDHVEALDYDNAHLLSFGLLVFSFVVLALVYSSRRANNFLLTSGKAGQQKISQRPDV